MRSSLWGHMAELADSVRRSLKEAGYSCSLINARFVKPLDTELLEELAKTHSLFVTIEENVLTGGFGEQVMDYVSRAALDVYVRNIGSRMSMWNTGMWKCSEKRPGWTGRLS